MAQVAILTMTLIAKIELEITGSAKRDITHTIDVKTVQELVLTGMTSTKFIENTGGLFFVFQFRNCMFVCERGKKWGCNHV